MPRFGDGRRIRIGLLGGSFNPAHSGHRYVAEIARKRLKLGQVWLLVSPGNPLKSKVEMAPFCARFASAQALSDGRRVLASAIEQRWGTCYSVETLDLLRRRFRRARFVWLMGADNLRQLPLWQRWQRLTRLAPMAVLPRPGTGLAILTGRVATALRHARRASSAAPVLARFSPPAWILLPVRQDPSSATAIRAQSQGDRP